MVTKLIYADHLCNNKRDDVCKNYKESLAVKMINIFYLQESLLCEVVIDNIKGYTALACRSPNQNSSDFQHFASCSEWFASQYLNLYF